MNMVPTFQEKSDAPANKPPEFIDGMKGSLTQWLDALDGSERERRLVELFRVIVPDSSVPGEKVSGFVDEALNYLELRSDHDAYLGFGLEARRLMKSRSLENAGSLAKLGELSAAIKRAEPDSGLKQGIDSIVASRISDLQACSREMAEVSGVDLEKANGAKSVKELEDMCSEKFREVVESEEYKARDRKFYSAIMDSHDINRLGESLKRKREVSIDENMIREVELEKRARSAATGAVGELSILLASGTKGLKESERLLRIVSALAYLRRKAPGYALLLSEVIKPVLFSCSINKRKEWVRSLWAREAIAELMAAICEPNEIAMCKAALLAERLFSVPAEREHRKE